MSNNVGLVKINAEPSTRTCTGIATFGYLRSTLFTYWLGMFTMHISNGRFYRHVYPIIEYAKLPCQAKVYIASTCLSYTSIMLPVLWILTPKLSLGYFPKVRHMWMDHQLIWCINTTCTGILANWNWWLTRWIGNWPEKPQPETRRRWFLPLWPSFFYSRVDTGVLYWSTYIPETS